MADIDLRVRRTTRVETNIEGISSTINITSGDMIIDSREIDIKLDQIVGTSKYIKKKSINVSCPIPPHPFQGTLTNLSST